MKVTSVSNERMGKLLHAYLPVPLSIAGRAGGDELEVVSVDELLAKMNIYLNLLLQWNAMTNLSAIRDPEQIVQRHFGESLFVGLALAPYLRDGSTLLDFGSGAGFPGLPIQVLFPRVRVTLGESQGKKAAFLREAVRKLKLSAAVWSDRVEAMPAKAKFDVVTMRAVDSMPQAVPSALERVRPGGSLAEMLANASGANGRDVPIPGLKSGFLRLTLKEECSP